MARYRQGAGDAVWGLPESEFVVARHAYEGPRVPRIARWSHGTSQRSQHVGLAMRAILDQVAELAHQTQTAKTCPEVGLELAVSQKETPPIGRRSLYPIFSLRSEAVSKPLMLEVITP